MLADASASLAALLRTAPPGPPAVTAEPPGTPGPDRSGHEEGLGLLPFHTAEEPHGRSAEWSDVRGPDGRVVARRPPVRRYRVHFLLWAWAPTAQGRLTLLSAAMTALAATETLPAGLCAGSLAGLGTPVRLTVAPADSAPGRLAEVWAALGRPAEPALEVVLAADLVPADVPVDGPPLRVDLRTGPS
ncbi:Pvc16 family protein [Kitasatospora sp. NPDC101176]|uniref:Pvc16 family protein n=1 Tax=Kitasatospora sp. NPDC101176 TaxID=3364099 RepID=UPI003817566D